jgi:hypothetical protein
MTWLALAHLPQRWNNMKPLSGTCPSIPPLSNRVFRASEANQFQLMYSPPSGGRSKSEQMPA